MVASLSWYVWRGYGASIRNGELFWWCLFRLATYNDVMVLLPGNGDLSEAACPVMVRLEGLWCFY